MNCDEPHLVPNEKPQPIQWTEWPTGALVAAGSLWPFQLIDLDEYCSLSHNCSLQLLQILLTI
jgi:hypothetical protein